MKTFCFTLALVSAASPCFAAKRHHHRHHLAPVLARAPTPVYLAPLGPRTAGPVWGSYGRIDEVRGACGRMRGVFSCPGN
jgi:hypothetical protein